MPSATQLAACIVVSAACASRSSPPAPAAPTTPTAAPRPVLLDATRTDALALHMRDHYDDLQIIERHLVDGDLYTVREYAFALALERKTDGLDAWADELAAMRRAAYELGLADDVEDAAKREAALAVACSRCHVATGADLDVEPRPLPSDGTDALARMARHQWAADRLWQAMITQSDRAWREGMEVLAVTPLPTPELTVIAPPSARRQVHDLGAQLQRLARQARSIGSIDARGRHYGEILGVCAACHAAAK
jgi:cytochrome c553